MANLKKITALSIASLLGASFIFTGCGSINNLMGAIKNLAADGGITTATSDSKSVYDSLGTLKSPSSEDELFSEIQNYFQEDELYTYNDTIFFNSDGVESSSETQSGSSIASSSSGSTSANNYSDTNLRTENVQESDIVKTDGNYIYSLRQDNGLLSIVDAATLKSVYSGTVYKDDSSFDGEMYITGNNLILAYTGSDYTDKGFVETTFVTTYDITDKSNPEKVAEYKQAGSYETTRLVDNYLYVFSNYITSSLDEDTFMPTFNGNRIDVSDVYYGHYFDSVYYTCIGAIDLNNPSECKSKKAVLTGNSQLYVSDDHIFICTDDYVSTTDFSGDKTSIVSLEYKDGNITGKAIGCVSGGINDSFSIDYYNNYLRLVTTLDEINYSSSDSSTSDTESGYPDSVSSYKNGNSLFILDDSLNQISSLDNIEENEDIKSSRFIDDTLYFVTYENTDPLFAVDLSDPKNPTMLGGLQISGFSNYLHFYGDNMLLGIGYETDSNGFDEGVKLSMFDVSDPHNIQEVDREVIDDAYLVGTDYSYKSVLVDPDKNLIGFAVESSSENDEDGFMLTEEGKYLVYSYDKNEGFKNLLDETIYTNNNDYKYYINEDTGLDDSGETTEAETETVSETDITDSYQFYTIKDIRGLYINDNFYIVKPGFGIGKYDLTTFNYIDGIQLSNLS